MPRGITRDKRTTQQQLDIGRRLVAGGGTGDINFGDLQEEFGTGLENPVLASITGNRRHADANFNTNLDSAIDGPPDVESLRSAFAPSVNEEQGRALKRHRGRAAASGIQGGAVEAQIAESADRFRAINKTTGLSSLAETTRLRAAAIEEGAQGFFNVSNLTDNADLTSLEAEDFRSLFTTLSDLGFDSEVRQLLARDAGQTVNTGAINEELFGALQQFVNPILSQEQSNSLNSEARRLKARFIAPGENANDIFRQRRDAKRGQLTETALAENRRRAGEELNRFIGSGLQELRVSAQQLQAQSALTQAAIRRGDTAAVLNSNNDQFNPIFKQLGVSPKQQKKVGQQFNLDSAALQGLARLTPFQPRPPTPTFTTG